MSSNIALFGFMGVGKTVVGRALAERLALKYVDLDDEIVKHEGKSIPDIFSEEGEAAFRAAESNISARVASKEGQVIACGGGTVLNPGNVKALKATSFMVLLTAEPETILKRVESEGETRPLLMVDDKIGRIESLLRARNPSYLHAADLIIDTTGLTPHDVADIIVSNLGGMDA